MIKEAIKTKTIDAVNLLLSNNGLQDFEVGEIEVERPDRPGFGDYAINIAFALAKKLGKSPSEIADLLATEIAKNKPVEIDRVEAVGGYVNFFLADGLIDEQFKTINSHNESYGNSKNVIVEYSSPNIAKQMHIGHLRSTIIGDALANVYKKLGYEVIRWNYIGDWGTQFGKVILQIKKDMKDSGKPLSQIYVSDLSVSARLYVKFHEDVKSSPELEDKAREEFKKLEDGDKKNREIWQKDREESLRKLSIIYKHIGVYDFDLIKGESNYEAWLKPLIEELKIKNVAKESNGALVADGLMYNGRELPLAMLRKSDGATLYMTRDLASLKDRIDNYQPLDRILYVVANQQELYFEQLTAIATKLGWLKNNIIRHVKFGMVLGEDGKKLATREGKVVLLEDVLNEAENKALKVVKEKNPDLDFTSANKIAHAVAVGALKYNDLKQNPNTDIKFEWSSMLDFTGNSGPYLQYTYARFASILNKAGTAELSTSLPLGLDPEGKLIERHIINYWDILFECTSGNTLNGLALYLYELAVLLNRFYENVRVLGEEDSEKRNARLRLIQIASDNLSDGLKLLGIEVLQKI